ncbi:hypothetical protein C9J03_15010 [Photobacterium gaetbulicola]|uniref:Uncharacterized protein n=1 Tax=Photobacterium gaetbulicola Gung47 TaxID=658445 RepID=A0A0C5WIX3_9GAMM|nr:hypothetical protein H744_1c0082 [Photobacterium gaetbulicola Gung47]PSU06859.1 hypothetical protein C9J03_15010 [Photobacterium gaetbulicola]
MDIKDDNGIDLKINQQYYIEHLVNLHWRYFNAISDDDKQELNYLEETIAKTRENLARLTL